MANKVKKVDVKKVAKEQFSKEIKEFLVSKGYTVADGTEYGFTNGTLVIGAEKSDVQVKFITPKAGVERYEKAEAEVE